MGAPPEDESGIACAARRAGEVDANNAKVIASVTECSE